MKLPNGFGSVYKLHGNRRKPWAVRITTSRVQDSEGFTHWKYKYLGYYKTKEEALVALTNYNQNPYDLDANKTTFTEVYEKWSIEHFPKISESNQKGYSASYKSCSSLYDMKMNEIRKSHLQNVVDTCGKNYPTLRKLKVLFNSMYKFALENDIVGKDYSQFVDIAQYKDKNPNTISRSPFSVEEIEKVWTYKNNEYCSVVLMLLYSGCRVSELLDLKKENVNLEERCFDIIASKTKAGIRKVPISQKTFSFFEYWMHKNSCEYLLSTKEGEHFLYRNFYDSYWKPLMKEIDITHNPHDTRHTCISNLTLAGVDDKIIKKIVGHAGKSVTEKVYTHFEIQILLDAIDKI